MGKTIHRVTFILLLGLAHLIDGETHHKRSPLGFQGVRGKRSIDGGGPTSSVSDSSSTELIKLNNEHLSSNNNINNNNHNNNQINGDVSVTRRPDEDGDNSDHLTNNEFHDPMYYQ